MSREKISFTECFGLKPFSKTLKEAKIAILGENGTPRTKADLTTIRQYKPKISIGLWLGKTPKKNKVTITNLYNYHQPSLIDGWSVKVTKVEDFRGRKLTYDSHNGTDFSIPLGSKVVAPAPARVLRISSEFNRGGLKIFLDHGDGLITTLGHLARSFVKTGDVVHRGQVIALSGYSGIDALLAFPFSAPHVHVNTWLNGFYVDPFSKDGSVSLWRNKNLPTPANEKDLEDSMFNKTIFSIEKFEQVINEIENPKIKAEILEGNTFDEKAMNLIFYMNYYPWRFKNRPSLYETEFPRKSILDLPFSYKDFNGIIFADRF